MKTHVCVYQNRRKEEEEEEFQRRKKRSESTGRDRRPESQHDPERDTKAPNRNLTQQT